jgi:hypothetical protein
MHMHMRDHDNMLVVYVSHRKKSFAKYRWRTYSRWQITLIPVVSSSGMTYANVESVPREEHNRYMIYITTYPPVAPVRLTLHVQRCICYENVFTSCGRDHKTSRGVMSPPLTRMISHNQDPYGVSL